MVPALSDFAVKNFSRSVQKLASDFRRGSVVNMPFRQASRVPLRLPVSVGRRAALSADISDKGFSLESPTLHLAGEEVSGFVLHGPKELKWTGRVVWVAPGNPMASTWHRLGIEFTTVSPGLRALLSMRQREMA